MNSVHFISSTHQLDALNLLHADNALYLDPPAKVLEQLKELDTSIDHEMLIEQEKKDPSVWNNDLTLQSGCTTDSGYVQTQWNRYARGGSGNSYAGPYFWGHGGHNSCNTTGKYNHYYALDHDLHEWDPIYPHRGGTIIFAGWAGGGWSTLGRMVIVDYGGGRWGVMAHLRSLSHAAWVGNYVNSNTLIGYAGGSGDWRDSYWKVHLHQSLQKDAVLTTQGLHSGQSARPNTIHYDGGNYPHWSMSAGKLMRYRPGG